MKNIKLKLFVSAFVVAFIFSFVSDTGMQHPYVAAMLILGPTMLHEFHKAIF